MKKFIGILFACIFCATLAVAQNAERFEVTESNLKGVVENLWRNDQLLNVKFDFRLDYQEINSGGKTLESSFVGQTAKLWFVGEVAPGIRYRIRHRINGLQDGAVRRENFGPATDQAYIELDAGSKWTFRVGKQSVQFGTFEYDINPADVYMPTFCFSDVDAYKTGINVAFKADRAGNQVLNLQVVNSDEPQFTNPSYSHKSMGMVFLWEGRMLNSMLNTRYGFGAFQRNSNKYFFWTTIGNQLNIGKFTAEADWYNGSRYMDFNFNLNPGEDTYYTESRDNCLSLNMLVHAGKFMPNLKAMWNERSYKEKNSAYQSIGLQAGVEFHPFGMSSLKELRFHAMYVYNRMSYKKDLSYMADTKTHTAIVGLRWFFKVK